MAKIAQEYNNEKRIVLFKNEKFESGKDKPMYWGYTWIDGKQYRIALWCRVDSNGKPYYQGQVQDNTQQPQIEMEFEDQSAAVGKAMNKKNK